MSTPIPKDIESGEQWQVRWTRPDGAETTRTGNEAQMRWLYEQRREFGSILESRTITVGPWVDPDAPGESDASDG